MEYIKNFMYPFPSNLFTTTMFMVTAVSLSNAGLSEIRGKNMKYSKFFGRNDAGDSQTKQIKVSSRNGMLIAYTPAFLAGFASFALFPNEDFRLLLLKSALTLHFLKRILEVLFLHKYSGGMNLATAVLISLSYGVSTATMIYFQHLSQGYPEPRIDLTYQGIVLFLIGISGNFYHHYLLSKLRNKNNGKDNDKAYRIPKGGLFDLVICPHYSFEILVFWGTFFISQTAYAFSFALGTTFYLIGRSYATRRWYIAKFDDFSKDVKALIPFVF